MKRVSLFLLAVVLCVSCSQAKIEREDALKTHNPLGVIFKSKRALTVETTAGPCVFYLVDATKVPPNRRFYLYTADDPHADYPSLEVVSDSVGCLRLAANQNILLRDYLISMAYKLPGEVSSVWLVSENKNNIVKTSFVPYPLQTFGSDGAEITLTRATPDGASVLCDGVYFLPQERLHVVLHDKDSTLEMTVHCCNGRFAVDLKPLNLQSYGAMLTIDVKRENGEVLTISSPWGRESFNKELLYGNYTKLTQEDYEKIDEAVDCYYKKTSPDALI